MTSFILQIMTLMMLVYFIFIIILLVRMNIKERMDRGITKKQAIRDILNEIFTIKTMNK
jgi:uncharacterized membrane protein